MGVRRRSVQCIEDLTGVVLSHTNCHKQKKPQTVQRCLVKKCTNWRTGPWSPVRKQSLILFLAWFFVQNIKLNMFRPKHVKAFFEPFLFCKVRCKLKNICSFKSSRLHVFFSLGALDVKFFQQLRNLLRFSFL